MLPAIFHTELWYTPEAQRGDTSPAEFLIRTFPYHFLSTYHLSDEISKLSGVHSNSIERTLFEYCIVDYRNIIDAKGLPVKPKDIISVLPAEMVGELLEFIFKISMYTPESIATLSTSLYTQHNPRFSDKSWNCETCQSRKLDRLRNCPFLNKEGYSPDIRYDTIDGVSTVCPIGLVDTLMSNRAMEAYIFRNQSLLPEDGGIRNQTVFFIVASQKMSEVAKYYEGQSEDTK